MSMRKLAEQLRHLDAFFYTHLKQKWGNSVNLEEKNKNGGIQSISTHMPYGKETFQSLIVIQVMKLIRRNQVKRLQSTQY